MAAKKVAILGGGPAALAAAFDLANQPDDFEVTIYTLGWRLGGKCSSGRSLLDCGRNEEHGLHLPMGFYENFFDQIRQAYGELGTEVGALRSWEIAFQPRTSLVLEERMGGEWYDWPLTFAVKNGVPGNRAHDTIAGLPVTSPTLLDVLQETVAWLKGVVDRFEGNHPALSAAALEPAKVAVAVVMKQIEAALLEVGKVVLDDIGLSVFAGIARAVWPMIEGEVETNLALRKFWITVDLIFAFAKGLLLVIKEERTLGSLDGFEFTKWLDDNAIFPDGLRQISRDSAPLRMVYELVFAYENGDSSAPSLAAGVAVRGLARLVFGYAGAIAYDMAAGMGETVIYPYYAAMKKRNPALQVKFFSRVRSLELTEDGTQIGKILFDVQAVPKTGDYDPTTTVAGIHVWPNRPFYDKLQQGAQLQASPVNELPEGAYDLESSYTAWPGAQPSPPLVLGTHFDLVVLAIPSSALGAISSALAAKSAAWQDMLTHVTGVPTVSMQVWSVDTAAQLGWPPGRAGLPAAEPALVGSFADNLGTIADMTRVVALEDWTSAPMPPQSSYYFCGPMQQAAQVPPLDQPAPKYLAAAHQIAKSYAQAWTGANLGDLELGFVDAGAIDDALFAVASPKVPVGERFAHQYFHASVNASELYITSFPGSTQYRLKPDCKIFTNLFLAGDWTANGMNSGALEAAVTSGRMAARAILGKAYRIYGEGDGL